MNVPNYSATNQDGSKAYTIAKLGEYDSVANSFRAASLECVQTTPGLLGATVYDLTTLHTELRTASFKAGAILSVAKPFPRFGVGIGLSGDTRVMGMRLTSSNVVHVSGANGVIVNLKPDSHWCNICFDWDLILTVAETHGYSIPASDDSLGMSPRIHDSLGTLLSRAARNDLWSDLVAAELEDELALAVLRGLNICQRQSENRQARRVSGRARIVHRVIDYIRAEFSSSVTVTELCRINGVSERTLQYIFKEATGVSVQQYLKAYRLQRARLLLRGECSDVRAAAMACGMAHPGRFARYYKDMFWESPRESKREPGT